MAMTRKELIENLSKGDPDEFVWANWCNKSEMEDYFVEGCVINDKDWEEFVNMFEGDWDYLTDVLTDVMSGNLENVHCDGCSLYDYKCVTYEDTKETLCRHCGEEEDLLNG